MLIALYVMAGIFALLTVATIAASRDRLAAGIRGTVRYGVVGAAVVVPIAALVALLGVCIWAIVSGVIYMLNQ
ncbi:MAG: hypothetical protein QUS33_00330 [Dehalococcoidia bacterium]|nr:hypothetical protein [Dehalococcoidia bacterium]